MVNLLLIAGCAAHIITARCCCVVVRYLPAISAVCCFNRLALCTGVQTFRVETQARASLLQWKAWITCASMMTTRVSLA